MNSCIHRRPTNRFLRDDVAGGSMHRNESFASPPQRPAPTYSIVSSRRRCETTDNIVAVVDGQFSLTDRKKKRQDSNDSPTSKLMLLAVSSSARAQFAKREPRFKRDYTVQLERETQQLRQEIEKLEQRRRPVLTAVPPHKSLWSVVVQLFHFGIRGETGKRAQLNFLQKPMATDVMTWYRVDYEEMEVLYTVVSRRGGGASWSQEER
ncbi:hypothetical protein GQ600_26248 [Phytophthora cactorum]|nr:hypothetical protein GQ600_26248 [Phytophthora cactorum]